jgi:hypothetical protein
MALVGLRENPVGMIHIVATDFNPLVLEMNQSVTTTLILF